MRPFNAPNRQQAPPRLITGRLRLRLQVEFGLTNKSEASMLIGDNCWLRFGLGPVEIGPLWAAASGLQIPPLKERERARATIKQL